MNDHITAVTLVGRHTLGGRCTLLQGLSPCQSLKALFLGFRLCGKYLLQTTDMKLAEKSVKSIAWEWHGLSMTSCSIGLSILQQSQAPLHHYDPWKQS
jgi:hypothetical protein